MESILNKRVINTEKTMDVIITTLIVIGAFLVPTFLAKIVPLGQYQQIVVGTIVNMSLILTALFTKGTVKTIAIAMLPSASNILGGFLFKGMTVYTQTMIPAIWLGNFALIYFYKYLFLNKNCNYIVTATISTLVKAVIIYLGFVGMTCLMEVPEVVRETLNVSMGITQVITAASGSVFAWGFAKVIKNTKKD